MVYTAFKHILTILRFSIMNESFMSKKLPKMGTESPGTDFHETPAQGGILPYVFFKTIKNTLISSKSSFDCFWFLWFVLIVVAPLNILVSQKHLCVSVVVDSEKTKNTIENQFKNTL